MILFILMYAVGALVGLVKNCAIIHIMQEAIRHKTQYAENFARMHKAETRAEFLACQSACDKCAILALHYLSYTVLHAGLEGIKAPISAS